MKKSLFILAAIIMMAIFTNNVMAQSSVSADGKATLKIPISIVKNHDMDFGTLAASASAGTVALAATSGAALTASVGVTIVSGTTAAAQYTVTGEPSTAYTITIPTLATNVTGSVSGTVTIENMTCSIATTLGAGLIEVGGTQSFYVGGTLHVPANTVAGNYSGSFNVSVNY